MSHLSFRRMLKVDFVQSFLLVVISWSLLLCASQQAAAQMKFVQVNSAVPTSTNFICAAACCDAHKSNDQLMTTRRKDWTKSTFNIRRKDKCDIENSRYPTHLARGRGDVPWSQESFRFC